MKKYVLSIIACVFILANTNYLTAQEGELAAGSEEQTQGWPKYTVVSKTHWNWNNEEGTPERWLELEKEYHEKVTMKNELIMSASVSNHYFTDDNSEALFITHYKNWADIETAGARSTELEKEAWPDSVERQKFLMERNSYYAPSHSDEIYFVTPYYKKFETSEEPMLRYIRVNKLAFPVDGKMSEARALQKEFHESVTYKNEVIKGFAAARHAWGSDGRDWVTVFALESLGDLEKMFDRNKELIEEKWPDEEERKSFMKSMNKYFSPQHEDYLYMDVPELHK